MFFDCHHLMNGLWNHQNRFSTSNQIGENFPILILVAGRCDSNYEFMYWSVVNIENNFLNNWIFHFQMNDCLFKLKLNVFTSMNQINNLSTWLPAWSTGHCFAMNNLVNSIRYLNDFPPIFLLHVLHAVIVFTYNI